MRTFMMAVLERQQKQLVHSISQCKRLRNGHALVLSTTKRKRGHGRGRGRNGRSPLIKTGHHYLCPTSVCYVCILNLLFSPRQKRATSVFGFWCAWVRCVGRHSPSRPSFSLFQSECNFRLLREPALCRLPEVTKVTGTPPGENHFCLPVGEGNKKLQTNFLGLSGPSTLNKQRKFFPLLSSPPSPDSRCLFFSPLSLSLHLYWFGLQLANWRTTKHCRSATGLSKACAA